ncbi:MAG: TolC family protein [bacterium]
MIDINSQSIRRAGGVVALVFVSSVHLGAQQPVTRADAARAAFAAGTRVALARADTAAALARLLTARALPNPVLSASYSKSTPQKHVTLDIPVFDALWNRAARLGQASASAHASRLVFASERLAAMVEVDTTYTRALAAHARFRLSRQTALDADSLRKMTERRRDAGDASDLDVDLATVVAGQQTNTTANDSLSYMSALLTVQTLMGIPADSVAIVLADSLVLTPADSAVARVAPVPSNMLATPSIMAAEASLQAAEQGIALQKRSAIPLPSLSIGFEQGDPSEPGILPLIGFAVPLPFFNRNQGPIAEASAERDRARVQLTAARLEARQRLVEGTRERDALLAKLVRDRDLVVRADRVAARSLTAYREGAAALPAVLEARRSAREVLGQYIDDLAALLTVNTELRALTQTVQVP